MRSFLTTHSIQVKAMICSVALFVLVFLGILIFDTEAVNIATYRDTLSDSAPNEYSNHTVEFTTQTIIPPGGYIRVRPDTGSFDIPTSSLAVHNVELYVDESSSGFVLRPATSTADATYDGVAITSGTSGDITVTLNSTDGIPAGSRLRLLIGDHTSTATTTDLGIKNPSVPGTYPINIEIGGGSPGSARALVAIIDPVYVGPVDTTEEVPPFRFNGAPTGELSGVVSAVEISFETDELATCRYSTTPGTAFGSMTQQVTNTGQLLHTFVVTGLVNDTTYTYYVRCIDDEGNFNIDDYTIQFTIPPAPDGTPGGGDEGSDGDDDGTGSGDTGSGSGSTSGNTSGGSTGSGGGGGGGSGGGGTNNEELPYESGDGIITINGFAFPNSTVTVLVDGSVALSRKASANGAFSITIEQIARGVYTFGVYAVDSQNVRSTTFTTTFTVIGSRGSTLSNVHLMPTILVTPNKVEPGQVVTFSGYAIPNSTVTIETRREASTLGAVTLTATSDGSGAWSVTHNTTGMARDTWKVRARSAQISGSISTNFSGYTYYGIGTDAQAPTGSSDLNRDGRVNLIDFSILLFHWNTDGGNSNPPADINQDGRVSLTDFSIMIFNWTG